MEMRPFLESHIVESANAIKRIKTDAHKNERIAEFYNLVDEAATVLGIGDKNEWLKALGVT